MVSSLLNPETISIAWESMTPKQIARTEIIDINTDPDFTKLTDKSLASIVSFIINKYGSDRLPGLELERRIFELGDTAPASFTDGKYHFFFGSLIRGLYGGWGVPYADWHGDRWNRGGNWLEDDWNAEYRVVLVKK